MAMPYAWIEYRRPSRPPSMAPISSNGPLAAKAQSRPQVADHLIWSPTPFAMEKTDGDCSYATQALNDVARTVVNWPTRYAIYTAIFCGIVAGRHDRSCGRRLHLLVLSF